MPIQKIGFIGIGNMGAPMASRLVKAGFDLTVYDARPETVSLFVERHGGKAARSPGTCARGGSGDYDASGRQSRPRSKRWRTT